MYVFGSTKIAFCCCKNVYQGVASLSFTFPTNVFKVHQHVRALCSILCHFLEHKHVAANGLNSLLQPR